MVLGELRGSISRAIQSINKAIIVNDQVLIDCLNEISRALLQADVQFKLVRDVQANIKSIVDLHNLPAGHDKRKIIHQAVFKALCDMMDPGKPFFTPKKGKTSVIIFVGLQGSGKTTTCTKYAYYHQKKGWKPALVCADTFRAGAFDQLKQNATKANKIPFHGSYTETDPVKIAVEGVERFKKENRDLIIVDTSGRHKQEASLFEEMRQVCQATSPDLVVFVMDGSIGQAAFNQAQAFKQTVEVGAVIVTKMDGHAKGGGTLSAIAATQSPVIFIGTGEHMHDFEVFDVKPFVRRLLGMGDFKGIRDRLQDAVPVDQQPQLLKKLSEGNLTLRSFYELLQSVLKLGPLNQMSSMLPQGFSELLVGNGKESQESKIKRCTIMMDSMTNQELDNPKLLMVNGSSRVMRIARGCGRQVEEVTAMLQEYKNLAKGFSKIPKKSKNIGQQMMSSLIPPQMLKQIGGMGGMQALMRQMGPNN
ncbi:unnamed protein product [Cuscuta epithymum]|uniref:Signal recognition particle 54 kDa protein n=1 Tax=Cuscuta epithymum TaxID=186058 RepID=A0AAV0G4X9_9ASTE|nr:unnamed protein product [Cuscuta epithymum]